ncbi:copper resistance CopC family protein [Leifsonia sp. NPDC080035]|uniref:Copper resistance CopC family protein n=1 Tax=Leifsonia sp. NPDC080035 TaxID=3143936 RepID=A0AAU7GHR9_9MICO
MSRRLLSAAAGLAAAIAVILVPATAASAHDYLVSSDPAADSTVQSPLDTVALTFNDRVLDLGGNGSGTLLTVTGPDGAGTHYETGCPSIADAVVSAPVALGAAGQYTVAYQVVSADGHTVSNSYGFRYAPPAGTTAAAGSASSPCGAAATTPAATPEPTVTAQAGATPGPAATVSTPQPTKAADSGNMGLVIGIAVAIVVIAIAGVLIVVLTARRKPPAGDAAPDDEDASPRE